MKIARALAPTLAILLPTAAYGGDAIDFSKAVWQEVRDEDGIHIYSWEPPFGELFAFQGDGVIDAPLVRVASVLLDVSRRKEWVPNMLDGRLIRKISPVERIEYVALKTPPLTANRDFVYHGKALWNAMRNELVLSFTSVEDPAAPEVDDMVRGRALDSTYTLTAVDGGHKTRLACRFLIDPRGSVPDWIVNIVQRNVPFNAIEGVRRQVRRKDVVDSPDVAAILR